MDESMISEWTPAELADELQGANAAQLLLVDVREPHEWAAGRVPGSVHIPLGTLTARLAEIPAQRTPVFICAVGGRSMAACGYLASLGRRAVNLGGGVRAWSEAFGPLPRP